MAFLSKRRSQMSAYDLNTLELTILAIMIALYTKDGDDHDRSR